MNRVGAEVIQTPQKNCGRTLDWWSGPGRCILDTQYCRSWKKKFCAFFVQWVTFMAGLPDCLSFSRDILPLLKYCSKHWLSAIAPLPKHAQYLCSRLPKLNAKFHIDLLFQLPIHDKITGYSIHVIRKTQISQFAKWILWYHSVQLIHKGHC